MNRILKINNDGKLKLVTDKVIPANTYERYYLTFEIDEAFADYSVEKKVYFQYFESPILTELMDSENQVEVPKEVIATPAFKVFVILKRVDGARLQTNVISIPCNFTPRKIQI